ncbi:MAG: ATP synthase F1 subunit gamma [Bacilli bacterium]|nr:ATP synthase F1 subunit gamma [Bacilli bacterium]
MSTLIKTKRRINSVTGTRKITNAMELVSSVKLKRFRDAMMRGNDYVNTIKNTVARLSSFVSKEDIDFDEESIKSNKRLFIIVNSNLGLCAHYNDDIFNYASKLIKEEDEIIPIGLKGYHHYLHLGFRVNDEFVSLNEKVNFDDVNRFAHFIFHLYESKKYKEIRIIFMQYVNSLISRPDNEKLLPREIVNNLPEELLPPVIEPNPKALLKELEPIYLASSIYQAILVSQVSEQSYRNNAMRNATDNADELLDKLKIEYNKQRQGAITQEIAEVVFGANELS